MSETKRIRWEPTQYGGFTGHAGTLETWLFQIHQPVLAGQGWVLTATFPGALNDVRPGKPDELKAEAERWLEEFISSLGASFEELAPFRDARVTGTANREITAALNAETTETGGVSDEVVPDR